MGMDLVVNSTPNLELKREREDRTEARWERSVAVGRIGERQYGIGSDYRIGPGKPTDWMMEKGPFSAEVVRWLTASSSN